MSIVSKLKDEKSIIIVIRSLDDDTIKLEYIDDIICILAFIFDINYAASFQILKQKDYINSILNRYNFEDTKTQEMVNEIRKLANGYVTSKTEEKTV